MPDFSLKAFDRPDAGCFEPAEIGGRSLDSIQIHFVIAVAQTISEAADRTPWNFRLMQFRESAQFRGGLRYLEKAHSNSIVGHTLIREHSV
jgi:hypothetical protein